MSEDALRRIEGKLDGLSGSVAELKLATVDFAVGQATLERRFRDIETSGWRLEVAANDMRRAADAFERFDARLMRAEETDRHLMSRLDHHERRIAALETKSGSNQ